jgi:hypothetical protein
MDKYWRGECVEVEVVVVVAGDGEVPHPAGVLAGCPSAGDDRGVATVRCAQAGAVPQGPGLDPELAGAVPAGDQNRWLLVVPMTAVLPWPRMVRSYRSLSWWTSTAATASGWVLPVLVLVASTISPARSDEIGTALPLASRTRVPAVKLDPPTGHDLAASSPASSAVRAAAFSAASAPAPSAAIPTSPSPPVAATSATVTAAFAHDASPG